MIRGLLRQAYVLAGEFVASFLESFYFVQKAGDVADSAPVINRQLF